MLELIRYLEQFAPLPPDTQALLGRLLKKKQLRKGVMWLYEGETCNKISFIEAGLMKVFFESGNREVALWYNKENDVVLSVRSFFQQVPSTLSIQAIEPCLIWYIDYTELMNVYQERIDFNIIGRKILEYYYGLSERHVMMMSLPPRERYDQLVQHYPWMVESNRFKEYMLADYLGIDRTTLSRYRNEKT